MSSVTNPEAILILDFDGTTTRQDAVDAILEAYADPAWLIFEEEWRKGRIGSRDCLRAQISLLRVTREELNALLDEIEVDDGLESLLQMCAIRNIPAHIVSDGFDYCIRRILGRAGSKVPALLRDRRVCASRIEPRGKLWRIDFPFFYQTCAHGCATCKPAVMRLLNPAGARVVFVGDGLSDQYAVAAADLVFAKNSLATYCMEHSIEYVPYRTLTDVREYLDSWLISRAFSRDREKRLVSA